MQPFEEFTRRAQTYWRLDERFAHHTKFFAAAALTNTVLAQLSVHRVRWICISRTTLAALMSLGGRLETVNLRCADQIGRPTPPFGSLDASFIQMEQSIVESVLRSWASDCAPRYRRLIAELDGLLHTVATGRLPLPRSTDVRRYASVLRSVAQTSGRCPSFASCEDRINIGTALIHEARLLPAQRGREPGARRNLQHGEQRADSRLDPLALGFLCGENRENEASGYG